MENLEAGDPRQIGPYTLIGRLGVVRAGQVFAGRSAGGQIAALTVASPETAAAPEFRERFRARAGAARAVSGDFVLPIVDADPDAPSPWAATAFVPGLPLRRAIERHGPLPEPALCRLTVGLAGALARIHAAGVVHGDAGPDSVLLAVDGPRIAAFGATVAVGSPADDIFGLGATVLFAGAGSELAHSSEDADTRITELSTATSALPPSLREVVAGCLYPDPSRRPTAEQLVDYLSRRNLAVPAGNWLPSALAADLDALAAAAPSSPLATGTAGRSVSRRSLIFGVAGSALLIGGAAAAAVYSGDDPAPAPAGPAPSAPAAPPPSSSAEPTPIVLDAPDVAKAWTATGKSAPTCLAASDKMVMVVTSTTTAFIDASTGNTALSALEATNTLGSGMTTFPTTYADGVFYYFCETPKASNLVAAVDSTTGNVKWATSMAMTDSTGPDIAMYNPTYVSVNGGTVYVCGQVSTRSSSSSDASTGYIRTFDAATGKRMWQVEGTDINNVLVPPSGSFLLAASSTPRGQAGQVQMIDAGKQGARGWKTPIRRASYYFSFGWPMTCFAAGLFCFAGGDGNKLFAVDAATGEEKWHQDFDAKSGDLVKIGTPFASLDGATVYVPVGSDLAAFNSADGTLKWLATLSGPSDAGTSNMFNASLRTTGMSAQCSADTVFVTDTAKNLWAIDAATGKARWKYSDPGQPDTGFKWTVGGDRVFVASNLTLTAIAAHGR